MNNKIKTWIKRVSCTILSTLMVINMVPVSVPLHAHAEGGTDDVFTVELNEAKETQAYPRQFVFDKAEIKSSIDDQKIYNMIITVTDGSIIGSSSYPWKYADKLTNHKTATWNFATGLTADEVTDILRQIKFSYAAGMQVNIVVDGNYSKLPETSGTTITSSTLSGDSIVPGFVDDKPHYYMYVPSSNINWTSAYSEAKSYFYMGLQGYLVTITEQQEDSILDAITDDAAWAGGICVPNTFSDDNFDANDAYGDRYPLPNASVNYWKWACGPEAGQKIYIEGGEVSSQTQRTIFGADSGYSHWRRTGANEPNNYKSKEYWLQVHYIDESKGWNDVGPDTISTNKIAGYFIEFSEYDGGKHSSFSANLNTSATYEPFHTHNWVISTEDADNDSVDDIIKVACDVDGCTEEYEISLYAPDMVYNASAYNLLSLSDEISNNTALSGFTVSKEHKGTSKTGSYNLGSNFPVEVGEYTYSITVSKGTDSQTITKTYKITPKPIKVIVPNLSLEYGRSVTIGPSSNVAFDGLHENHQISYLKGVVTADEVKTNGETAVDLSTLAIIDKNTLSDVTSNYAPTQVKGTLTVTPKELDVTWDNTEFTYDGQKHVPTPSINDDDVIEKDKATLTVSVSEDDKRTNVGSNYTATAILNNSNYTIKSGETQSFKINKREVNYTINSQTVKVGETVSISSSDLTLDSGSLDLVSGDAVVDIVADASTTDKTSNGNITITSYDVKNNNGTGTSVADNYDIKFKGDGKLTVNQHEYTVTFPDNIEITYGDVLEEDEFLSGGSATDGTNSIDGTFTWKQKYENMDAGNYDADDEYIVVFTPDASKYGNKYPSKEQAVNLKVNPRTVSVDWTEPSFVYNGDLQLPTAQLNDSNILVKDKDGVKLSVNAYVNGINAGEIGSEKQSVARATLVDGSGNPVTNYVIDDSYIGYTYAIAKRNITVKAKDKTVTYKDTLNPGSSDVEITSGTLAKIDQYIDEVSWTADTSSVTSSGENRKITLSAVTIKNSSGIYVTSNYNITYVDGDLTVNPKEIELEWDTDTFVYNGQSQAPSATIKSGRIGEDVIAVSVTGAQTNANSEGEKYTANASIDNANYVIKSGDESKQFTITKREVSYTVNDRNAQVGEILIIDPATDMTLDSGSDSLVSGHTLTIVSVDADTSKKTDTPVLIKVTAKVMDGTTDVSDNYKLTVNDGKLTVVQYTYDELIFPDDVTITYGESLKNSTANANGDKLVNGSAICDGESVSGIFVWKEEHDLPDAGSYTYRVTFVPGDTAKYPSEDGDVSVTVLPKAVTVTPKSDLSITYGDSFTVSTSNVEETGLLSGLNHHITSVNGYVSTDAGTNPITIYNDDTNGRIVIKNGSDVDVTSNYTITIGNGNLIVYPKQISVSWSNTDLVYNGQNQAPDASIADGQILSADLGKVSLNVSGQETNAGTGYTATASLSGDCANNYVLKTDTAATAFKISPKPITITANDITDAVYGDLISIGPSSVTVSDLVDGHVLTQITGTADTSKAGNGSVKLDANSAVIMKDSEDVTSNYSITLKDGKLTVAQKEIELDWSNLTFTYNGEIQAPSATIKSGVVGSDSVTVTVSGGQRDADDNITATASIDNVNYKIKESDKTANYQINKVELTFDIPDKTAYVNDTVVVTASELKGNPAGSALVSGDSFDNITVSADTSTMTAENETKEIDITSYQIMRGSDDVTDNYIITFNKGKLTVNQCSIVIDTMPEIEDIIYGDVLKDSDFIDQTDAVVLDGTEKVEGKFTWKEVYNPEVKDSNSTQYVLEFTPNNTAKYPKITRTVTVKVSPKDIDIIWDNPELVYNYTLQKPTASVDTDDLTTKDKTNSLEIPVNVTVTKGGTDAGTDNEAEASINNENYKITDSTKKHTYTIKKRPLTITAKNKEAKVDEIVTITKDDVETNGLVEGHEISVINCNADTSQATENGEIEPLANGLVILAGSNQVQDNYDVTYVKGKLKVTKNEIKFATDKGPSVTPIIYGDELVDSLIVPGEIVDSEGNPITGITGKYTFEIEESEKNPHVADSNTKKYTVIFTPDEPYDRLYGPITTQVTVTVSPKEVGVDWGSNLVFEYDGDEHKPDATVNTTDVVTGDTVIIKVTAESGGTNAGPAVAKATSQNPDYVVKTADEKKNYTVKPKNLNDTDYDITVTADSTGKPIITITEKSTGKTLIEDTDFEVNLDGNDIIDIEIKGIGNYDGKIKYSYKKVFEGNIDSFVKYDGGTMKIEPVMDEISDEDAIVLMEYVIDESSQPQTKKDLSKKIIDDIETSPTKTSEDGSYDTVIYLEVKEINQNMLSDNELNELLEAIKNGKDSSGNKIPKNFIIGTYLDLSLYMNTLFTDKNNVVIFNLPRVKITDTSSDVLGGKSFKEKVTLTIPRELKAPAGYSRNYYVIRVHDNGNTTYSIDNIPVKVKNGKISFETDKFSTYVLGYTQTKNPTKVAPLSTRVPAPQTGDINMIAIGLTVFGISFIILIAYVIVLKTRKRKHNNREYSMHER